jgi:hypothetical protein
MANYEEQKRVADLEIAWQNQLTVVTSSLTTAASVLLNPLSFCISASNATLACFDASIDANLEGKLL